MCSRLDAELLYLMPDILLSERFQDRVADAILFRAFRVGVDRAWKLRFAEGSTATCADTSALCFTQLVVFKKLLVNKNASNVSSRVEPRKWLFWT